MEYLLEEYAPVGLSWLSGKVVKMNGRTIGFTLLLLAAAVFVVVSLLTRPPVQPPNPDGSGAIGDPLKVALLAHMVENKALTAGAPADDAQPGGEKGTAEKTPRPDLTVARKGDKIEIALSEEFLEELGPGALAALGLPERKMPLSQGRYDRFLHDLHDLIISQNPDTHGHGAEE